MKRRFRHANEEKNFSEVLLELASAVPRQGLTLREIIERLEDRGLLMFCMFLTIPFLLPVSIPGSSTPFGLLIALVGLGLVIDRPPWLPGLFVDKAIAAEHLVPALDRGAMLFAKLERWLHPRIRGLSYGPVSRVNALVMIYSALLLTLPLPIPLSNTFPAYSVLLLAAGNLERDGYFILGGHVLAVVATVYIAFVGWIGWAGLEALFS